MKAYMFSPEFAIHEANSCTARTVYIVTSDAFRRRPCAPRTTTNHNSRKLFRAKIKMSRESSRSRNPRLHRLASVLLVGALQQPPFKHHSFIKLALHRGRQRSLQSILNAYGTQACQVNYFLVIAKDVGRRIR